MISVFFLTVISPVMMADAYTLLEIDKVIFTIVIEGCEE
jgi:hypothetical protein